jgi:hypothetical protein
MRTLPYGTQKNKIKTQAYGSGDGGGSNIVQGAHLPALPDRRRDLLEGGGRRGGDRQARLLSRRLHGAPDLRKVFTSAVIHYTHSGDE